MKMKQKFKLWFDVLFLISIFQNAQAEEENSNQIACGRMKNATLEGVTLKTCFPSYTSRSDSRSTTFSDMDDSVQFLSLLFNKKIFFLPVNVSQSFPNLLIYHAGHCSIETIKKINFEAMSTLRWLFLDGNQLERIDSDTFDDLTDLIRLEMKDNKIKLMNSDAFRRLGSLKYLHLSGNECIDEDFEGPAMASAARTVQLKCGFREGNKTDNVFDFECGKVLFNEGYVVGGEKVIRGQWPFVVALRFIRSKNFFCGGVVITTRHAVTAAHCIQNKGSPRTLVANDFSVLLGRYNLEAFKESGSQERYLSHIVVHPAWDPNSVKWDADVAVLVFNEPAKFTSFVQPVCLPENINIESTDQGTVVGWGKSESNQPHENIPRQVISRSVNDSFCYTIDDQIAEVSSLRTFCAGGEHSGPCSGDSGSGYFVKIDEVWTLRGIVSASMLKNKVDCDVDRFAIFTKIIDFVDWIKSATG